MKTRFAWACLQLALVCSALAACGDDDDGIAASCQSFSACGGDVSGDWQLSGLCIDGLQAMLGGIIDQAGCEDFFRASHVHPSGTFSFGGDGTLTVTGTTFTADLDIRLSTKCVRAISGNNAATVDASICQQFEAQFSDGSSPTIAGASCGFAGGACACTVHSVAMPVEFGGGPFQVQGEQLTVGGSGSEFCVAGDTLTIRTKSASYEGTLVFDRK